MRSIIKLDGWNDWGHCIVEYVAAPHTFGDYALELFMEKYPAVDWVNVIYMYVTEEKFEKMSILNDPDAIKGE